MENQNQNNQNNQAANMTANEKMALMLFNSDKGAVQYEVAGQTVKLSYGIVRNFLTKGEKNVTDADLVQFIQICKFNQLNPFLGEAYLVKYGTSPAQMIVSKEALMKRAENNPNYQGFEAGIIVKRGDEILYNEGTFMQDNDILLGGWARVYRDDRKTPSYQTVGFREFSKSQSTWKSMPATMIRKVAIVQALREAFPTQLGAMYTSEEKGVEDVEYVEIKDSVDAEISENANKAVLSVENNAGGITNPPQQENAADAKKSGKNDTTPFDMQ